MARKNKQGDDLEPSAVDAVHEASHRVQPIDIQQKSFRVSFRGYQEREVDEFLDVLTEELSSLHEEKRKLRLQGGGTDLSEASRQADEIRRRAREDADQVLREARAKAASGAMKTGAPDVAAVNAFLGQERDFLQGMASLINDHAETIKAQVTEMRSSAGSAAPSSFAPPAASTGPAPSGTIAGPAAGGSAASRSRPEPSTPGASASAWEATAKGPSGSRHTPASRSKEEEPSLRELFWGEE